jgi:Holliday junction DNA helicase RuvA
MFNSIRGVITEKLSDTVYIMSSGIEWDISVPGTDLGRLPSVGEEARVFTWLYHREDQMKLFGFADSGRRSTFLELLKVDGIGPKGALKILGGIGQDDLERALEAEDLARLEAVPGLGKKTAQKMILALKGKLTIPKAIPETPYAELVEALVGMGYDRRAAVDALSKAEKGISEAEAAGTHVNGAEREKLLFKEAIVFLSSTSSI